MRHPLLVITLKRTPERLETFYKINKHSLHDWEVEVLDGIDGMQQQKLQHRSRWVSTSAKENWSKGAIGSALSHIKAWRRCIELNQNVVIAEDDAVLAKDLKRKLEELNLFKTATIKSNLVLLGWNLDSLLHAELTPGLRMISLFEPIYPELEQIRTIINSTQKRKLCNLNQCFGLPAYLINPEIAQELLQICKPLRTEINSMGRGIPEHIFVTLDGMLINRYETINAQITVPPLVLAKNSQGESLTKHQDVCNFSN